MSEEREDKWVPPYSAAVDLRMRLAECSDNMSSYRKDQLRAYLQEIEKEFLSNGNQPK